MPALGRPTLWDFTAGTLDTADDIRMRWLVPADARSTPISVAKEIPALFARQLRDNKPSTATLPSSSGNVWYMSAKFWIITGIVITGIVVAILIVAGIRFCAASSNEMRQAEPPGVIARMEAEEAEEAEDAEGVDWPHNHLEEVRRGKEEVRQQN